MCVYIYWHRIYYYYYRYVLLRVDKQDTLFIKECFNSVATWNICKLNPVLGEHGNCQEKILRTQCKNEELEKW